MWPARSLYELHFGVGWITQGVMHLNNLPFQATKEGDL